MRICRLVTRVSIVPQALSRILITVDALRVHKINSLTLPLRSNVRSAIQGISRYLIGVAVTFALVEGSVMLPLVLCAVIVLLATNPLTARQSACLAQQGNIQMCRQAFPVAIVLSAQSPMLTVADAVLAIRDSIPTARLPFRALIVIPGRNQQPTAKLALLAHIISTQTHPPSYCVPCVRLARSRLLIIPAALPAHSAHSQTAALFSCVPIAHQERSLLRIKVVA
jgi:hypothetical protein